MKKATKATQTPNQIVEVCRRLHARNMLASADGNVSVREGKKILITPSGIAKAFMSASQMATLSLDGKILKGKPSAERSIHLEIYRQCPKAQAVVHAHPPHAIAWSLAHTDKQYLPSDSLPEVILACGQIPFVPYAKPTTEDMAKNLSPFLPNHRALILSRHGAVTWGESLEEAYLAMERLEHAAQILYLAHVLGKPQALPAHELSELRKMREMIGERVL